MSAAPLSSNTALRDALRRGWCPGALRPMATGDGLLVRLRITGGILPAGLARAVAEASLAFGNGLLDLSARANLQLRGVGEAGLPGLIDRLGSLGLLDADPDAESVRNVLASPLAGLAPDSVLDIRPVVRALEERLSAERPLHALPGKFGFIVDDGGSPSLGGIAADIRFEALRSGPDGAPRFRVRLAGGGSAATCAPEAVPDVASALGRAFLALRETSQGPLRRMAALVGALGDEAVFRAAGLSCSPVEQAVAASALAWGVMATGNGAALGVGAPFGRFRAGDLRRLADLAEAEGHGELRLTPFRAILLPGLAPSRAALLRDALSAEFIVRADDPRLAVAACPGAPACANATTPTQDDALALADVAHAAAAGGLAVHVSGCAKGCAHPGAAPWTLIGRDGRYDLVQNGTASDPASRQGLTRDEAKAALAAWAGAGKDRTT